MGQQTAKIQNGDGVPERDTAPRLDKEECNNYASSPNTSPKTPPSTNPLSSQVLHNNESKYKSMVMLDCIVTVFSAPEVSIIEPMLVTDLLSN